jgi:hypothetical protein
MTNSDCTSLEEEEEEEESREGVVGGLSAERWAQGSRPIFGRVPEP